MQHKVFYKSLLFLFISIFIFSCGRNKKTGSAPEANDSLANILAARDLSLEIEKDPENAELYYRRAQVFINERYLNRAEEDQLEAIKLDSLNPLYHFSLARNLYAMNQTQRAAKSYERAIALKPDYNDAILKLADLYFVVKEHTKSIDLLNRSLLLDKGNASVYHMLGMNYKEMGDTSRAIYHFQTAIENDPADFESNLYIANLYAAKRKPIAFEYFKAALKLRPKSVDALFGRAVFEQNVKLYKRALLDYRRVIDIDPQNFLSYFNVGYINYENGMFDEAIRSWTFCTQMNPDYANAFYMKGLAYEEKKNRVDARINYQVAVDLEPQNKLFRSGLERVK